MQTSTQDETHTQDKAGWVGWLQIGAIGAVIVIALVLTAVLSSGGDAPRQSAPERPATPVEIALPRVHNHQIEIGLTGAVSTPSDITLSPQVGGRVVKVSEAVRAGAHGRACYTMPLPHTASCAAGWPDQMPAHKIVRSNPACCAPTRRSRALSQVVAWPR